MHLWSFSDRNLETLVLVKRKVNPRLPGSTSSIVSVVWRRPTQATKANNAGAHASFHSIKQLRALLLSLPTPLGDMLFHHRVTILWRLLSMGGTGMSPRGLQAHPPQEHESYKFQTNNNKLINTYTVHDVLITYARFKSSHLYITCISHVTSSFIHLSLHGFQFFSNLEMILSHQKITPLTKDIKPLQHNSVLTATRFQLRAYIFQFSRSWNAYNCYNSPFQI